MERTSVMRTASYLIRRVMLCAAGSLLLLLLLAACGKAEEKPEAADEHFVPETAGTVIARVTGKDFAPSQRGTKHMPEPTVLRMSHFSAVFAKLELSDACEAVQFRITTGGTDAVPTINLFLMSEPSTTRIPIATSQKLSTEDDETVKVQIAPGKYQVFVEYASASPPTARPAVNINWVEFLSFN